jgi:hypothetical protein
MAKIDKKWCSKCRKSTYHKYAGSKSDYEGLGIARGILAVASLGISETVTRDRFWQCCECNTIRKD